MEVYGSRGSRTYFSEMGLGRVFWLVMVTWVLSVLCLKAYGDGSQVPVKFVKAPLAFSSVASATFGFIVLMGGNGGDCSNCSFKCKLDNQIPSDCESREVSYVGLRDGKHTFEVCTSGSQGLRCASYNWTVDTVSPMAYVTAERSFTNALNVTVNISFSEPCTGRGGFGCTSVNACNLLVYGAGQVIPSTLKTLQPNLRFSLLVGLSSSVQFGRVVLVMDKGFCTDAAGNMFTRTTNSSFYIHFDRRSVFVNLRTHVPEKLIELNSQTRTVQATNNSKNLKVYLYFSEPVLNSSSEIRNVLHTNNGYLVPTNGKSLGNRRFGYLVKDISSIAIVTISLATGSIISRQGTPVSPIDPLTFLYDTKRPSVRLSTMSAMRTKERILPILIKFVKPVFGFNSSALRISEGHLQSFHEISGSIYSAEIHTDGNLISVSVPENTTGDVAGNKNLESNLLQVRHYSVPIVSSILSTITTAAFAVTCFTAGLLTVSTASFQSLGDPSRPSTLLTSEPSRNLFRIASHVQVFALSKWLAVSLPIEYYEFVRGLQWSIPHLNLPWEAGHVHPVMVDSTSPVATHTETLETLRPGAYKSLFFGNGNLQMGASLYGLPLTPMEYSTFFEVNQNIKPEADFIMDSQNSNGWKEFNRNIFWLAVIGGGLILLHILILCILKFRRRDSEKEKTYGALIFLRFEIFLTLLGLPCICQASAAIIRGGSTAGVVVGILLLAAVSFLLFALLFFLSIGITMGKLLQYKEVHREGQEFHWYQDIVRATLGPGKRGQWSWKNQPNSFYRTMLGPLFEDLRGPPKYMVSQIADGNSGKQGDQIIASDDETEDAEAPFIQKLFGILRIYYTLLESVKRVALGIVAGPYLASWSSKFPTLIMLCITSFQLFFLVLKKPFIKKRVQFVEIISVSSELGIFATCFVLLENDFSVANERRIGIFMLLLFMLAFSAQMVSELYALYNQILGMRPGGNSFCLGLKAAVIGLVLILIPGKLLKNWDDEFSKSGGDGQTGETVLSGDRDSNSGSRKSGSTDKPWMKQLRELAKASFTKEDDVPSDPSSSQNRSHFWSGKRSGSSSMTSSADFKSRPRGLYKDLEAIFSSK